MRLSIKAGPGACAFVLMLSTACGGTGSAGGGNTSTPSRTHVVATTVQIAALTREVAGDKVDLRGLIPAGADPHAFEPSPSDLAAIESAQLILRNGIGLDDWLDGTLKAGAKARVVTVTDGIIRLKGEENGGSADDPHVWHDPENDKIMVDNIAGALSTADPANSAVYQANAAAYGRKLDETKVKVQSIIDQIAPDSRKLVTNHDALGYFAQAFGLQIVGAVIPSLSTEAEPSAGNTAALLDAIRREHVKAIFAESSVNPKLARTLAGDAGVVIVDDLYGDSLGPPGSGADTVDGMLFANAQKIASALK